MNLPVLGQPGSDAEKLAAPWIHLVPASPPLAFVVECSRLFAIEEDLFSQLRLGDPDAEALLRQEVKSGGQAPGVAEELKPPTALSLNIAQSCNLSCSYCYADEGRFGERAQFMPLEVAIAAIDRLLVGADGRSVTVGFIGGEPFLNRSVLHDSVAYASRRASDLRIRVGFSVTTNGTLLEDRDLDLMRRKAFSVSVSLDGASDVNDRYRRTRNGSSASARAIERLRPLLRNPSRARVAARATIPRHDLRIAERIEALAGMGFSDIGVSPLRVSPEPDQVLRAEDWPRLLEEMIRAAEVERDRLEGGMPGRFSNLITALRQIHIGAARSLPCGSAANYVSVSARGEYFTCHRTIGDRRFWLGSNGADLGRRQRFLAERQVDRQEPCRSCWARYLCGGGCHAEVIAAGRQGCDYIRGWLEYCLGFYHRVLTFRPDVLATRAPGAEEAA